MLFQQLHVGHRHAPVGRLAHVISVMMAALGFFTFSYKSMTYVRLMDGATSRFNLENSTLSQRSWTKLGQEILSQVA